MSIIATPERGEATGEVAEICEEDTASLGYVPSHTWVTAINPGAYRARENLGREPAARGYGRRPRRIELALPRRIVGARASMLQQPSRQPPAQRTTWYEWRREYRSVPLEGLEPPTCSLGRNCSSIELQRLAYRSLA
jgi:hypothetical protein